MSNRRVNAKLLQRIRKLAVDNRYPADWIAARLEVEKFPRVNGRWSAATVEQLASEHGITLFPHKSDSLAAWKPKPTNYAPPQRRGRGRRR
jgi:hypothetical protein